MVEYKQIFIKSWFYIQCLSVMCSYRVIPVILNSPIPIQKSKDDDEDVNSKKGPTMKSVSLADRITYHFFELITDLFTVIMYIITNILFFWRAKGLYRLLQKSPFSKWKKIIKNQFYEGGIEWSSFMGLLLMKWPVVFSTLWYLDTEKEDKSTWAQIFYREFVTKAPKGADLKPQDGNTIYPTGEQSKHAKNRGKYSDQEWKSEFRKDLQNIGFEFGDNGEITKFPPTEVMEQYQKSERFKELILASASPTANSTQPSKNQKAPQNYTEDIQIKDYPSKSQPQQDDDDQPSSSSTQQTASKKQQQKQNKKNKKK